MLHHVDGRFAGIRCVDINRNRKERIDGIDGCKLVANIILIQVFGLYLIFSGPSICQMQLLT